MKCSKCNKYLKKGHGVREYHHRGQYRYYCSLCLKIVNYHYEARVKDSTYHTYLRIFCLLLPIFTWIFSYSWFNDLALKLAISIIPSLIIYWLISNLVIKPKVKAFKEVLWIPLEKEQSKLKAMENYVDSLSNEIGREYCYCEKCLETEWNKKK